MTRHERRVRRDARRWPDIKAGEWLFDLGRPTPAAVRVKAAYEYQQRNSIADFAAEVAVTQP